MTRPNPPTWTPDRIPPGSRAASPSPVPFRHPRRLPSRRPPVLATALPCLLLAIAAGCGRESPCGPSHGTVERVVDGDTIALAGGVKVRYLNVDTPEDTSSVECQGPEATAFNESRVLGRDVELTYDEQCTDRYGRLLAHVWSDGRDVGLDEVTEGYGCVLILAPNVEDRQAFEEAEMVARAHGRGVWQWGGCDRPWPCGD